MKKRLTLKILILLLATDCLETSIQFFFKKTAVCQAGFEIRNFADLFIFVKTAFFTPYLWLGFLSVLLTFIVWSTILSKLDLSVAVPICSFSYILVPLMSLILLHEKIPPLRWMGIFFILTGVMLVSMSTKEKEEIKI